jgi:hypothetical protein
MAAISLLRRAPSRLGLLEAFGYHNNIIIPACPTFSIAEGHAAAGTTITQDLLFWHIKYISIKFNPRSFQH